MHKEMSLAELVIYLNSVLGIRPIMIEDWHGQRDRSPLYIFARLPQSDSKLAYTMLVRDSDDNSFFGGSDIDYFLNDPLFLLCTDSRISAGLASYGCAADTDSLFFGDPANLAQPTPAVILQNITKEYTIYTVDSIIFYKIWGKKLHNRLYLPEGETIIPRP